MKLKTLLIIPAYNEEENIKTVVEEVEKHNYDYIVINDGSKDKTAQICKEENINMLDLPFNLGLAGAVQAGMKYSLYNNYDIAIQIDGDGQHDISYVHLLIDEIEKGATIAVGSRFLEEESFEHGLFKKISTAWLKMLLKVFGGYQATDPTSGMRAYNRFAQKQLVNRNNFKPEPETMAAFNKSGFIVREVQVQMREREFGESYLTPTNAVKYMINSTISIGSLASVKLRGGEKND